MGFDATGGKPYKASQDGPVWYAVVAVVAVLAFGGAFLGPKLLGGGQKGAIQKLVEGRTVPEAAGLINAYGFKDETTRTFLARLQKFDPAAHAELLTEMGTAALQGGDRQALATLMIDWTQAYVMTNANVLRHSDPRYIDKLLPLARYALDSMSRTSGDLCELDKMMQVGADPNLMQAYTKYGGPLYDVAMQGNSILIGMVENGRKRRDNGASDAYFAEAEGMTQQDETAITAAMMTLMADKDVQKIMMNAQSIQNGDIPTGVNVCSIGSRLVGKIEELDPQIRQRLWATVVMGRMDRVS